MGKDMCQTQTEKENFEWHHLILWSPKPNWLERVSKLYVHFRWIGKTTLLHFVRYLFIIIDKQSIKEEHSYTFLKKYC